jgi:xanthine dehydrogenase accessory factor
LRDLLPDLEDWLKSGQKVALATVISTWGSAPRPAGSMMAVSESGGIAGSVSGGCVEGAVVSAARKVIKTGQPQRLHFGVSNEDAWGVGLACGGEIELFVQPAEQSVVEPALARLKAHQNAWLSTIIQGEENFGAQQLLDKTGVSIAATNGKLPHGDLELGLSPELVKQGETEIFVNPLLASPTLVIVGGAHIAIALVKLARTMDFRTVVIDPRKVFGSEERFAHADKLIQAWPQTAFEEISLDMHTALASLSHDPKIDDPAVKAALESDAFYVGALGSSRTTEQRRQRLLADGVSEEALARLHAPIGLDIDAQTPEEIALAIMAQVIAEYRR